MLADVFKRYYVIMRCFSSRFSRLFAVVIFFESFGGRGGLGLVRGFSVLFVVILSFGRGRED